MGEAPPPPIGMAVTGRQNPNLYLPLKNTRWLRRRNQSRTSPSSPATFTPRLPAVASVLNDGALVPPRVIGPENADLGFQPWLS